MYTYAQKFLNKFIHALKHTHSHADEYINIMQSHNNPINNILAKGNERIHTTYTINSICTHIHIRDYTHVYNTVAYEYIHMKGFGVKCLDFWVLNWLYKSLVFYYFT